MYICQNNKKEKYLVTIITNYYSHLEQEEKKVERGEIERKIFNLRHHLYLIKLKEMCFYN